MSALPGAALALAVLGAGCRDATTAADSRITPSALETSGAVTVQSAPAPGTRGRIAFASDRDGDSEIFAMNADETGITQLTTNSANDIGPVFSPTVGRSPS